MAQGMTIALSFIVGLVLAATGNGDAGAAVLICGILFAVLVLPLVTWLFDIIYTEITGRREDRMKREKRAILSMISRATRERTTTPSKRKRGKASTG